MKWLHHEEAAEDLEAGLAEGPGVSAGWVQKQLRFDAVDLRRVQQQLKEMPEQGFLHFVSRGRRAGQGKDVADNGLGLLVDAEGIAGDLAILQGRVSGQHVVVQILR